MDSMWRKTEDGKVDLRLGRKVEKIASARKRVTDDQGSEHFYEKLLLATGGTPRQLPFDGGQIIYYRNLRDYQRLRALTEKAWRFAVIGGGFIGSGNSPPPALNRKEFTMSFPRWGSDARRCPRGPSAI